ncbi:hypothetical protein QFC22_006079 [Naganishia vaughanmartiniae]|uniref:Uncharacterized protein n=1 Tax=Naganishia vaughanmartiniae TaxID=1424756 RepID=A0ACC2WPK7_9TREE|nr:hypothetical protein QFC22_006079 [Naganishia vaughanmartiniae]
MIKRAMKSDECSSGGSDRERYSGTFTLLIPGISIRSGVLVLCLSIFDRISFDMTDINDLPVKVIDIIAQSILEQERAAYSESERVWAGPVCACATTDYESASKELFISTGSTLVRLASVSPHTKSAIFEPRLAQRVVVREHTVMVPPRHGPNFE